MSFYSGAKAVLAGFFRFLFNVKIEGRENEIKDMPFLICANHISLADPIILGASLQHNPRFMAKKELMGVPILKQLVTALGAYSIDRGGSDVAAIKKTISLLKDGESVIMFPQGTRHKGKDPRTTEVKHGCSMIAAKAGVAVLPIYIETKNHKIGIFKRTTVRIGKHITPEQIAELVKTPDDYKKGAELIFSEIVSLANGQR